MFAGFGELRIGQHRTQHDEAVVLERSERVNGTDLSHGGGL